MISGVSTRPIFPEHFSAVEHRAGYLSEEPPDLLGGVFTVEEGSQDHRGGGNDHRLGQKPFLVADHEHGFTGMFIRGYVEVPAKCRKRSAVVFHGGILT